MKFKLFTIIALAAVLAVGCSDHEKVTDPDDLDELDPEEPNPPNKPHVDVCANVDFQTSRANCGKCGNVCGANSTCQAGTCVCDKGFSDCDGNNTCETEGECICHKGETLPCYSGPAKTENVGNCHGGLYHCIIDEDYGADWDYICEGEFAPFLYPVCSTDDPKGDSDCNGVPDYLQDEDYDGFAACSTFGAIIDCCDSKKMCNSNSPEFVNPDKIVDCVGNNLDDDCDGEIDEDDVACDTGLFIADRCVLNDKKCDDSDVSMDNWDQRVKTNSAALAMARAMDLCMDVVSIASGKAGIIEYSLSKSSSAGPSTNMLHPGQVGVLNGMEGENAHIPARVGSNFLMLSSGTAGDATVVPDVDKDWDKGITNIVPNIYLKAHDNKLQSHKMCKELGMTTIYDSAVLHFKLKAPTTAQGFSFDFRFFSKEYPFFICSPFNDFFLTIVTDDEGKPFVDTDNDGDLLDEDGNVSFDKEGNAVSVNNAFFTTCVSPQCGDKSAMGYITSNNNGCPGSMSCSAKETCGICEDGYQDLYAYTPSPFVVTQKHWTGRGGGTAWLTTSVPVSPGQVFNIDFYIWDTGDAIYDSSVIIDNFRWHCDETVVGTDFAKPIEEIY